MEKSLGASLHLKVKDNSSLWSILPQLCCCRRLECYRHCGQHDWDRAGPQGGHHTLLPVNPLKDQALVRHPDQCQMTCASWPNEEDKMGDIFNVEKQTLYNWLVAHTILGAGKLLVLLSISAYCQINKTKTKTKLTKRKKNTLLQSLAFISHNKVSLNKTEYRWGIHFLRLC